MNTYSKCYFTGLRMHTDKMYDIPHEKRYLSSFDKNKFTQSDYSHGWLSEGGLLNKSKEINPESDVSDVFRGDSWPPVEFSRGRR